MASAARPTSLHYLKALLAGLKSRVSPEAYATIHKLALPSSGGQARADAIRRAKEAQGTGVDRAPARTPGSAGAPHPASPESEEEKRKIAVAKASPEYAALPVDVQGAIYELCEEAGLVGDEPDDLGELDPDVLGAIYTLGEWAGLVSDDGAEPVGEATDVTLQKDQPDGGDMGGNPKNSAPLGYDPKGTHRPVLKPPDTAKCAKCGKPTGHALHEGKALFKAEVEVEGGPLWFDKGEADERLVAGVVLHPGGFDSHGHRVSAPEIELACHRFAEKFHLQKAAMDRQHDARPAAAIPVENYIAPADFRITDPTGREHLVLKGSWVMVNKVQDAELMGQVERGEIASYSVAGDGWQTPVAA